MTIQTSSLILSLLRLVLSYVPSANPIQRQLPSTFVIGSGNMQNESLSGKEIYSSHSHSYRNTVNTYSTS